MRRRALAVSSGVAALGLVVLSGAPASAATLPATDELFSITQDSLFSTLSTGSSTYIADVAQQDFGKYGADFDVTTGLAYYFADGLGPACTLYSLDPTTGVSTEIGPVSAVGMDECDALNVDSDGVVRIADQDGVMITVNKATGATIVVVTVTGVDVPGDLSFIEQSSTGQFYVGTYSGGLYTLNVTTGATVFVAQPTDYIETASFDSADTLWISGNGDQCQGLNSLNLTDPEGSFTFEGDFIDADDNCLGAYATFVSQPTQAPAPGDDPELAATGGSSVEGVLPFAVLASLAGIGALVLSRRRRQVA